MVIIIKDEKVIGYTSNPQYIRNHPNGEQCYLGCEKSDSQGICFKGQHYSIAGANEPLSPQNEGETLPVVVVVEADEGSEVNAIVSALSIAFVTLAEKGDIDDVTAGENHSMFEKWEPNINYKVGVMRVYADKLYKCIQEHKSQDDWTPEASTSLWKLAHDPAIEYPEWSQPIGAMDAYNQGDKVQYKKKKWVSDVANNVWEPGVYGWSEVEEG